MRPWQKSQDWFFRNHEPPPPERSERSSSRSHECRSLVTFKELVVLLCQVLTCNGAPDFYSAPTRPDERLWGPFEVRGCKTATTARAVGNREDTKRSERADAER